MKYIDELFEAMLDEDFYATEDVLEMIIKEDNTFEYVPLILEFMEKNPELDYGIPGPIVHFVEKFYKNGYEELLLKSVSKVPTNHTLWMLNRIINDPNLQKRDKYMNVLKEAEAILFGCKGYYEE